MKSRKLFLLCACFLAMSLGTNAQTSDPSDCVDVVYLRDGSIYRGRILEQPADGPLVIQTWGGVTMQLDAKKVRRVVQRCPEDQLVRMGTEMPKPYNFRERGWYNATSMGVLAGRTWWNENTLGFSLHNSTGYAFCRQIAVGLGAGIDLFLPYESGVSQATYPLYAEARGYFLARKISPFYAVGAGWGFAGGGTNDRWGYDDRWRGGWLGQIRLGYRIGNHFTLHGGLHWQQQKRVWTADGDQSHGQDRILHQRFELGFGLLL